MGFFEKMKWMQSKCNRDVVCDQCGRTIFAETPAYANSVGNDSVWYCSKGCLNAAHPEISGKSNSAEDSDYSDSSSSGSTVVYKESSGAGKIFANGIVKLFSIVIAACFILVIPMSI